MARFRKKPVVIEAVQWSPDEEGNQHPTWPSNWGPEPRTWKVNPVSLSVFIPTLEGEHQARKGDWIIKGVKGEFYPCKPDIFEATYDPA